MEKNQPNHLLQLISIMSQYHVVLFWSTTQCLNLSTLCWNVGHMRPERHPPHLHPENMHPALREKGRVLPVRTIEKQAKVCFWPYLYSRGDAWQFINSIIKSWLLWRSRIICSRLIRFQVLRRRCQILYSDLVSVRSIKSRWKSLLKSISSHFQPRIKSKSHLMGQ